MAAESVVRDVVVILNAEASRPQPEHNAQSVCKSANDEPVFKFLFPYLSAPKLLPQILFFNFGLGAYIFRERVTCGIHDS
jgi:hypothetical protein